MANLLKGVGLIIIFGTIGFLAIKEYRDDTSLIIKDSVSTSKKETQNNTLIFRSKVKNFIDECSNYSCPDGAICEPCQSSLQIETSDGQEISIMPPKNTSNFKDFSFIKEGNTYEFEVIKEEFEGGLIHYILVNIR